MAEKKPKNPLIQEILDQQKVRSGRRILSWVLFLLLIISSFALPIAASVSPQDVEKYTAQHAWAKSTATWLTKHNILQPQELKAHTADASHTSPINKKLIAYTANTENGLHVRSTAPTFLGLDKVWNPGHPLDNAHKPWANDCKVCHSFPFVQVQDSDCKTCHDKIGDHVNKKTIHAHGLENQACTDCHKEHNGDDSLSRQNKLYTATNCAACHGDIKHSFDQTKTENVTDFAKKHPEFRYQIATANPEKLERVRYSEATPLKEPTALKFPHDVHLSDKGIKSPQGRVKMECNNCHKLNPDGLQFGTVNMKDHCQSCHDLKFEPAISNREVPHGSVELVLNTLREFYSYVQVNTVPIDNKPLTAPINLVRPGKEMPVVQSFVRSNGSAHSRAADAAISLFEKTSCKVCHEVTRLDEKGREGTTGRDLPQWKITPIAPSHPWLTKSQFSHAKHTVADCTDCHSAKTSKKAEDVLMPDIKVCRDCHTGSERESNKLVSDCGLCHEFHMKERIAPQPLLKELKKMPKQVANLITEPASHE